MTIREAGKGIVTNRKRICSYRIGFINSDGREDELEEVYQDYCKENGFRQNTVIYVER